MNSNFPQTNPEFSIKSHSSTENKINHDSRSTSGWSRCQITPAENKMLTGYVQGNIPEKNIADRLHIHQMTKLDHKKNKEKERIFNEIVPSLMSEMGMSQTSVLTNLIPALELTPYLRKIERGEMVKISDQPSDLQTELLLELTTRIKQGHRLHQLCQQADKWQGEIAFNEFHQTIYFGTNIFEKEDLGDETFRELRARLLASSKKGRQNSKAILDHIQKRKAVSMAHWQKILLMVLNIQDSATRQCITNTLHKEHELSPSTVAECEALTSLIPTLKLIAHPSFSIMKPLFSWLSQHQLKGDKLSSQYLMWLKSMVTNRLYTKLPAMECTGLKELCTYKELPFSGDEAERPGKQQVKKAIDDASPQQLTEVVELFNTLLCDLTPSVNAENRLGIIYTLLKFRDQSLLKTLLEITNIGRDALLAMYKTQLILTYSLDEKTPAEVKKEKEQKVNCLLKTLQLRMARSIIIIASKDGVSVPPGVMNKAKTLIDHHNEGLQAVLPDHVLHSQDTDDDNDDDKCSMSSLSGPYNSGDHAMPSTNTNISEKDYLTVPYHLLTNGRAITLDSQLLMLPKDKHLRIPASKINRVTQGSERRVKRRMRDEKNLREDFLLSSRSTDLTQPVDWIKMDVPITFLFTKNAQDKRKIAFVCQVFNNKVLPVIQQTIRENAIEAQQTMDLVRELLALSESIGKPGIDLRTIITSIQNRTLNRSLHPLLQQMATALPRLPGNHDRKQLVELTALQLFAEINPSDRQFKRLIKMLYIIQSRSEHLQFSEGGCRYENSYTSRIKLKLARLIRRDWSQPDDLLANRIRQSVKSAFKNSDKSSSYRQVMDSILDSIRPSDQPSEDYPKLIHQMILEVETAMNEMSKQTDLTRQANISLAQAYTRKDYLCDEVKRLIESSSQLCKQFRQQKKCVVNSSQASPDIVSATSLPSDHYLHDQLHALILQIGNWLNQTNDDELISEGDAIKAGINTLVKFAKNKMNHNPPLQNEEEIVAQIIELRSKFHSCQIVHSQWQSTRDFDPTYRQSVDLQNTVTQLEGVAPLSPLELEGKIYEVISGSESHEVSPEDQQLLTTVSALRAQHIEAKVRKALSHPNINEFQRSPEQLSRRIEEMNLTWSDSAQNLHRQCESLKNTLYNQLQTHPLYRAFKTEKLEALNKSRERHRCVMDYLQYTQQKCESHPLKKLSYLDEQSLLSILQSMELSHTAKHSGIEAKPLSKEQKQQLKEAIESVPAGNRSSGNASLFDWIGMGKTRHQRKSATSGPVPMSIDGPMMESPEAFLEWKKIRSEIAEVTKWAQNVIENSNKTLTERDKAHADNLKSVKESEEKLFNLLGNRIYTKVMIAGQKYSYADALVAFKNKDNDYLKEMSSTQMEATSMLRSSEKYSTEKNKGYQENMKWLTLARECQSREINPEILPKVIDLMVLEERAQIDDVESQIDRLQQQIQTTKNIITENSEAVKAAVEEQKASLKPELDDQIQKTRDAQQALFSIAFEHGDKLSWVRATQRVLCQYVREKRSAESIKASIVEDCEAQEKHVPSNFADIIETPRLDTAECNWMSQYSLPFHIINVPGAFPLLESLYKQGRITPSQLLSYDDEDKRSSALIFAAAKGRYGACETLLKCLQLQEVKYLDLETINQLLTASPSGDNRNLLHHIAQLARPETMKALLQLLTNVSKKQDFDADYPSESLINRVALDKEYLLKTLLTQVDNEGFQPADLLLFNVAKRIREWPEHNEQALTSYCNDFLINEAKSMWILLSESCSVEQLYRSLECFMKGIDNLDELSTEKRQAAEIFLKNLMRIFRVHGPKDQHEKLINQLASSTEKMDLDDNSHTAKRPRLRSPDQPSLELLTKNRGK